MPMSVWMSICVDGMWMSSNFDVYNICGFVIMLVILCKA